MRLYYSNEKDDFEYEIDYDETKEALEDILNEYSKEKIIKMVLEEFDIQSELEEYFHDDIKDYYEKEAWDYYEDTQAYVSDPMGYHGLSDSDFL